jgi:phage gp29-like protein
MFIQLGHTESGSRALGETFVDFFALSLQTIATWFADTFTAHVIEDWVDVNFGEEEPAPRLGFDPGPNDISVDPLAKLIDSGALVVDQNLRSWVRDRYGLPESAEPESTGPVEPPPLPVPAPSAPVPEPAPVPA